MSSNLKLLPASDLERSKDGWEAEESNPSAALW